MAWAPGRPAGRRRSHVAGACVVLALAFGSVRAADRFEPCESAGAQADVQVSADSREDRRLACLGAADAIDFFRSRGLRVAAPIRIAIVDEMPPTVGRSAVGCFLERSNQALLVRYARFRRNAT